jgi:recombination protein RecA
LPWVPKLGVPVHDQSKFLLFQPETLEQGVALVVGLASQKMDLLVLDSVGAAVPKVAFELSIEDIMKAETKALGLQARAWSSSIPLMLYHLKMGGTAMIAVAQQRDSISPMSKSKTVVGGNAWKYYSSVRLEMRQISTIKGKRYNPLTHKVETEAVVGTRVLVKVKKAKVSGTSNYEAVVECIPGKGFDPFQSSVSLAIVHGVIKQSGSWYSWDHPSRGEIRYQGKQKFMDELRKIRGVRQELDKIIRPFMRAQDVTPTEEDEEPDYHDGDGDFVEGEEGGGGVSADKLAAIAEGKDFSVPEEDD